MSGKELAQSDNLHLIEEISVLFYPTSRVGLQQSPTSIFPTFIFPSVVCVNQLCLGLHFFSSAASKNLDWIPDLQCSLTSLTGLFSFWHDFQAIMGRNFNQSEYVAVNTIFDLQEVFLHVNLLNICSKQVFHSINLSNVRIG